MKAIVMVAVDPYFDHQSSHLGTIMMIISLRLGTIRILFIAEPLISKDIEGKLGKAFNID